MIELLVVIAIIAVLASMLLPALSKAKEQGKRIQCVNDERQFALATVLFVDDNEGRYPPRASGPGDPRWPELLRRYYTETRLLACPSDNGNFGTTTTNADAAPRSYLINGWNDELEAQTGSANPGTYGGKSIRDTDLKRPAETILFGEKLSGSQHYYMDLFESVGNDFTEVEQSRHSGRGAAGGSNYAFADGSVRYLKFGKMLDPENLWCNVEYYRANCPTVP